MAFDSTPPEKRAELPEFEFEVEMPDSVIDQINIKNLHNSLTLSLV